jgi:hypothetical protein
MLNYSQHKLLNVSIDENEISYQNIMQVLLTVMLVVSFSALLCSKCSTLLTQESEKSPVYVRPIVQGNRFRY